MTKRRTPDNVGDDDNMTEKEKFYSTIAALEAGEIRVAEKVDGQWKVNSWIKETILSGFRLGQLTDMTQGQFSFFDKDTIPARKFTAQNGVRIVPGGSSVRAGAYLAPSVIMMPPAYVNIGAYVDEGTMIDSHALVGSCAQVGKHVHLSAASQLGGVLEPVGALPVIIEDNAAISASFSQAPSRYPRWIITATAVYSPSHSRATPSARRLHARVYRSSRLPSRRERRAM